LYKILIGERVQVESSAATATIQGKPKSRNRRPLVPALPNPSTTTAQQVNQVKNGEIDLQYSKSREFYSKYFFIFDDMQQVCSWIL